jgi:WD40 repeat protein
MWNRVTGQRHGAALDAWYGSSEGPDELAFSPDGKVIATVDSGGFVDLWNVADAGSSDPSIEIDLDTIPCVNIGVAKGNEVDVAFSPDGKLLATTDGCGTVRLWNPKNGHQLGVPIKVDYPHGRLPRLAFSPIGDLLAATAGDGTVGLWNASQFAHPFGTLCADVGLPVNEAWGLFAPGEQEPKICA